MIAAVRRVLFDLLYGRPHLALLQRGWVHPFNRRRRWVMDLAATGTLRYSDQSGEWPVGDDPGPDRDLWAPGLRFLDAVAAWELVQIGALVIDAEQIVAQEFADGARNYTQRVHTYCPELHGEKAGWT